MDLSLVPIDDIFKELDKRFDVNIVLTIKNRGDKELYEFHQFGGHMAVIGLCEQMAFTLKDKKETDINDEFYQD